VKGGTGGGGWVRDVQKQDANYYRLSSRLGCLVVASETVWEPLNFSGVLSCIRYFKQHRSWAAVGCMCVHPRAQERVDCLLHHKMESMLCAHSL